MIIERIKYLDKLIIEGDNIKPHYDNDGIYHIGS